PLLRHLRCEDCWLRVVDAIPPATAIRRDIFEYIYGARSEGAEAPEDDECAEPLQTATRDADTSGTDPRRSGNTAKGRMHEPRPIPEAIDQFVRSYHVDGDPVARTLPDVLEHDLDAAPARFLRYGDFELHWSDVQFSALVTLTRALYPRHRR